MGDGEERVKVVNPDVLVNGLDSDTLEGLEEIVHLVETLESVADNGIVNGTVNGYNPLKRILRRISAVIKNYLPDERYIDPDQSTFKFKYGSS